MMVNELLASIVVLALLVEWLTERMFGHFLEGEAMVYISTVVGVALALAFQVDGCTMLGLPVPVGAPYTGQVVTGLIIGAGSNVVHAFFSRYIAKT